MAGRGVAVLLALAAGVPPAPAAEQRQAVTTEARVVLRGVRGEVELRTGAGGELRWSSLPRVGKLPAPLVASGSETEIVLAPPAGDEAQRKVVLIVPPQLAAAVEAERSRIVAAGLQSELSVRGRGLEVRLQRAAAPVELELAEGSALLEDGGDAAIVRGSPTVLRVLRPTGPVKLALTAGTVHVTGSTGEIEAELSGVTLDLSRTGAGVQVIAQGGTVEATELLAGGSFDLTGTPLRLEKSAVDLRVRTDASVEFRHGTGGVSVQGTGAAVRGSDHEGDVEIRSDGAEVSLADMRGSLLVVGSGLTLLLDGFWGEGAALRTTDSSVQVRRAGGPLTIESDGGDVAVEGAGDRIAVESRRGNVTLTGLSATADVEADAESLTVSWTSLPTEPDAGSTVANHGGAVRVELPPGGYLDLDAESFGGQIESALAWVKVSGDARTAQGVRGRERAPRLRVTGQGNVVLAGVGPKAAPAAGAEPEAGEEP